jgi:hypothetical protein
MPTFCRHNRFIERCPICSRTLPGASAASKPARAPRGGAAAGKKPPGTRRRAQRAEDVRVHRELRAVDDGFRSPLVQGLRASPDAQRLAHEIAFSSGRLAVLAQEPPGLYGEARALAAADIELASWQCFLIAYLAPLEGDAPDPFAGIRQALGSRVCALTDLDGIALGARSSHEPARGMRAVEGYCKWVANAGGQRTAFTGDPAWSPERRFARVYERLALPGFARAARYELLVILGGLGLYELRADSLHLGGSSGVAEDPTVLAAKRVFGIGDPLLLERRAAALAQQAAVPIEVLDLALSNWAAPQRATLGFSPHCSDQNALERAQDALGI